MLQTLKNAWKEPDIRKRILFCLFILLLYRIGAVIPVPFVNSTAMQALVTSSEGSVFEYLNLLSGSALSRATLFALSISPYITASIVIQLLGVAFPKQLGELSKTEEGKKKLNNITRYVTVALALVTSIGYYFVMKRGSILTDEGETFLGALVVIASYCAGAALIMWLAEKINENGIGNGISLILFANIIAGIPGLINGIISSLKYEWSSVATEGYTNAIIVTVVTVLGLALTVAIVFFIAFFTESERRIPIQYAKRVVGRKMYGGQSTHLPMKVNMSGVMPIIFASSIISIPSTIAAFFPAPDKEDNPFWHSIVWFFSYENLPYAIMYFALIILFAYFYITISFNPTEVANNLKKNGGVVPGIRQGKPTADYITRILNKITLIGALFLGVIAVLPLIINLISSAWGHPIAGIAFGGSSIIIVVGVVLETIRELESQLTLRNYKGFLS